MSAGEVDRTDYTKQQALLLCDFNGDIATVSRHTVVAQSGPLLCGREQRTSKSNGSPSAAPQHNNVSRCCLSGAPLYAVDQSRSMFASKKRPSLCGTPEYVTAMFRCRFDFDSIRGGATPKLLCH